MTAEPPGSSMGNGPKESLHSAARDVIIKSVKKYLKQHSSSSKYSKKKYDYRSVSEVEEEDRWTYK